MKRIQCEMCGSNDLIKENGVFVCQNCGTQYSVEEAKKMMIEGNVDVSGSSVKIDNSDKVANYYIMAENAYNSDNKKEAEEYCNKIIENDPKNYKAWVLKGKAAAWQSTLANLRFEEAVSAFKNALDNTPENELAEVKLDVEEEISNLCRALNKLACGNYVKYPSADNAKQIMNMILFIKKTIIKFLVMCNISVKDMNAEIAKTVNSSVVSAYSYILKDYNGDDAYPGNYAWEKYIERVRAAIVLLETAVDLSEDDKEQDVKVYENLIFLTKDLEKSKSYTYSVQGGGYVTDKCWNVEYKNQLIDKIMKYHQKIKEIKPDYIIPERPQASSGCYVATCVYGSYDCPEVWTLRRFRDFCLDENVFGRLFIKIYYFISPKMVNIFGKNSIFINFNKTILDNWVKYLNKKGYSNTEYYDKY